MTVAFSLPPLTAASTPVRLDDPARLAAVASIGLLDEPVNPALERLVRHTARLLGVPTAVVSLIGARQHFVAAETGLAEQTLAQRELPLTHSLCAHSVRADAPLVIDDTRRDERWADHPAAVELGVVAYCGVPLRTAAGQTVGTLCAADGAPRPWSAADVELLAVSGGSRGHGDGGSRAARREPGARRARGGARGEPARDAPHVRGDARRRARAGPRGDVPARGADRAGPALLPGVGRGRTAHARRAAV